MLATIKPRLGTIEPGSIPAPSRRVGVAPKEPLRDGADLLHLYPRAHVHVLVDGGDGVVLPCPKRRWSAEQVSRLKTERRQNVIFSTPGKAVQQHDAVTPRNGKTFTSIRVSRTGALCARPLTVGFHLYPTPMRTERRDHPIKG